jgi:predicted nucleic acid-binding protein
MEIENLILQFTRIEDEIEAIHLSMKMNLNFDDALQYHIAKKYKVRSIVSFDKHFDKTNIKRILPSEC